MSAAAIETLEQHVFPQLTGLLRRLDLGIGTLLDAGASVAAVSIELCRRHPRLRAVALEPLDEARHLAERRVAEAGIADRITVRAGLAEDLEAEEEFDSSGCPATSSGPTYSLARPPCSRSATSPTQTATWPQSPPGKLLSSPRTSAR
jgi:hypothetical protein